MGDTPGPKPAERLRDKAEDLRQRLGTDIITATAEALIVLMEALADDMDGQY